MCCISSAEAHRITKLLSFQNSKEDDDQKIAVGGRATLLIYISEHFLRCFPPLGFSRKESQNQSSIYFISRKKIPALTVSLLWPWFFPFYDQVSIRACQDAHSCINHLRWLQPSEWTGSIYLLRACLHGEVAPLIKP